MLLSEGVSASHLAGLGLEVSISGTGNQADDRARDLQTKRHSVSSYGLFRLKATMCLPVVHSD